MGSMVISSSSFWIQNLTRVCMFSLADLLSRGYSKLLINVSGLFVSPATCLMAPAPRDPELDKRKKLDGWFLLKSLTLINTEQNPVWIGSHLSTQRFGKAKLS